MKLLVDMNLSPKWIPKLQEQGFEARHWSEVGRPDASDEEILRWVRDNGYVLFTNDLDFGAILAASKADCPSVFQLRMQNLNPEYACGKVVEALQTLSGHLEQGALISIDEDEPRAHVLPIE